MIRHISLAAAAALALAALPVAARDHGPGQALPAFETFDTDGDGRITRDEVTAARRAAIDGLDADGDGVLAREEIVAFQAAQERIRIEARVARLMESRDLDADGRLSADEIAGGPGPEILGPAGMPEAMMARLFARIDADDDGVISRAEADEARERMQDRPPHGPRHGGPRGRQGFWGPGDRDQEG